MYEHYKEAVLPLTYRQKEIKCIITSLAMQRSVRVAGLSGMGKSNLLRFLASHPQLLTNIPAFSARPLCFLHIDCNKLNPINGLSFFRECLFLLQKGQDMVAPLDEYLAFKHVEATLSQLDKQMVVILVVDRTERLYQATNSEFFSQLRSLRDEARSGQMMFILGSQRPLGDLYELEKLFSDICWIGPLAEADRSEFFTRHEKRLGLQLNEALQQLLWNVSGAHLGFLKNGLEWVARQEIKKVSGDTSQLMQAMLRYKPIQNYGLRLWENLTETEQNILMDLETYTYSLELPSLLLNSGLVIEEAGQLQLFSPLWKGYLQQHVWLRRPVKPMEIQLDPATRRVTLKWRGRTTETVITRKLVFELLQMLAAAPDHVFSKDELITVLYPEDEALETLDDALFQLVTALRKVLDDLVKRLCPAMTDSCIKNVRKVGYRLVIDLPT